MGNLAALKAKLREIGYDGDGDMVVGGVIAAEVIVHLTACYTLRSASMMEHSNNPSDDYTHDGTARILA